jgi:ribosomal protein L7/L12
MINLGVSPRAWIDNNGTSMYRRLTHGVGYNKIEMIKAMRDYYGANKLGLKEAKDIIESVWGQ